MVRTLGYQYRAAGHTNSKESYYTVVEYYSTGTSRRERESDYKAAEYCSTIESDYTAALCTNFKLNIKYSVGEKYCLLNYRTVYTYRE